MRTKRRPLTVNGRTYPIELGPDGLCALDEFDRVIATAPTRGALVAEIRAAS